jgi:hypothetical protein
MVLNHLYPLPSSKAIFLRCIPIPCPQSGAYLRYFPVISCHPTHCNFTYLLLCHIIHPNVRHLSIFCNIRYLYGEGSLGCSCAPGKEISYLKIYARVVQLQTTENLFCYLGITSRVYYRILLFNISILIQKSALQHADTCNISAQTAIGIMKLKDVFKSKCCQVNSV